MDRNSNMVRKTATILGTKVRVCSLIWVAAWKMDTSKPMTMPMISIGAEAKQNGLDRLAADIDSYFGCHGILRERGSMLVKTFIKEPTTRLQPSTSTKRRSLNGMEMMTGGSIIIPMDMRIDATIMSITRKGI
jgi:hypothetical protein